ncbi:MAG TPA: hypothetical protein VG838_18255 [Opitutaceae bacterium]|nr:hypothetical protein [Opitutaceae bacterium]
MNTRKLFIASLIATGVATGAGLFAQVQSVTPAPSPTTAAASAAAPAPNEINYVSQLPTPSELSRTQPPAGARIAKIRQTSAEIAATYVYANGQSQVVTYRLLGTENDAAAPAPAGVAAPAPGSDQRPVVVQSAPPPPPVYYYDAPPTVVYYDRPYSYYPWYPPISLGLNFGFRSGGFHGVGFRGGFFHGGFHR